MNLNQSNNRTVKQLDELTKRKCQSGNNVYDFIDKKEINLLN